MRVIGVTANEKQPLVTYQGNTAIVNLGEAIIENGFSYSGIYMDDAMSYSEEALVEIATKFLNKDKLANLTITTTAGNVFDANESARNSMLSALTSATFLGLAQTDWKLADNTVVLVTVEEIKEALALSIQAVGAIVTAI